MNKMLNLKTAAIFLAALLTMAGCENDDKAPEEKPEPLKIYIDDADYDLVLPMLEMADSLFRKYEYEFIKTTAFDAMKKLLTDTVFTAAIISRDYSSEEMDKMIQFKVEQKTRLAIARDALVFITGKDNPLDTLSDVQIRNYFTRQDIWLKDYFPELTEEPRFAITNHLSSPFENLRSVVLNEQKIVKPFVVFSTVDSVKNYILENENDIGICYLSHIARDDRFKALKIGFVDSTDKYVKPTLVHQTSIVMGKYPYEIKHYMYLYDEKKLAANKMLRFLGKSPNAQQYFNEAGIVPAFGDFRLIQE